MSDWPISQETEDYSARRELQIARSEMGGASTSAMRESTIYNAIAELLLLASKANNDG